MIKVFISDRRLALITGRKGQFPVLLEINDDLQSVILFLLPPVHNDVYQKGDTLAMLHSHSPEQLSVYVRYQPERRHTP